MAVSEVKGIKGKGVPKKLTLPVMMLLFLCIFACAGRSEKDLADLQSPNPVVKREAIENIGKGGGFITSFIQNFFGKGDTEAAVPILVEMLESGEEPEDTQLSVLKARGRLGKSMEVPVSPLIERLKDENPQIRLQAVESLGKLGSKEAVPPLLKLLDEEPNKYPIIWALGEIRDERAIPALNKMLAGEDEALQYNARKALKKIQ